MTIFVPMKNIPLSEKQKELVDMLSAWDNSYISISSRMGYWLVLGGDVKERINTATVTALERKKIIKREEGKFVLWQN